LVDRRKLRSARSEGVDHFLQRGMDVAKAVEVKRRPWGELLELNRPD
jgi:hypothetical protein